MRGDAADEPWRFSRLLAAPHRLGFFTATTMLAASALWWLAVLATRLVPGWGAAWAIAPNHGHALLMGFSFVPMFFAGFLCTAGPRWLDAPPVPAHALAPTAAAWLAGWAVFLVGAHVHAWLAAFGLAVAAAGWSLFAWRFARLLGAGRATDRTHARVIGAACGTGAAVLWAAAAGLFAGEPALVHVALAAGLWWFLAPVFAAAMHRMVPALGVATPRLDARHPNWLLWALLAALVLQVPLSSGLVAPATLAPAAAVLDTAAAMLVLWLAWHWARAQNLRIRLLAMLFVGFVWLGVAFALQALAAASAWWGDGGALRLAALHALGMGFFGSIQLAFVTRVSAGRHGRAHAIDGFAWTMFWSLQAAVALRLAAAWHGDVSALLVAAAAVWAATMLAWSARHARWYGLPRSDGRSG